jgi:hypothetical protein
MIREVIKDRPKTIFLDSFSDLAAQDFAYSGMTGTMN